MRTTHKTGNFSQSKLLSKLLETYDNALLPFGDGSHYDLVFENKGRFCSVQCKTAWYSNGCLIFNSSPTNSIHRRNLKNYRGKADYFGVYAPYNGKCYLIPVPSVSVSRGILRLTPTKNNQAVGVLWAKDFEI